MVADITERKRAEEALSSARLKLFNARLKLIEAQEQERTRIARELHDDIGQRLALLTIELNQLHMNSTVCLLKSGTAWNNWENIPLR